MIRSDKQKLLLLVPVILALSTVHIEQAMALPYTIKAQVNLQLSTQTAVGVNTNTNTVYATNSINNTVSVVNGATNTITTTVHVGKDPIQIGVNNATNEVYVSNQNDNCATCTTPDGGSVSVINSTNGVSNTIGGIDSPWGIGVNTVTNKIYVAEDVNGAIDVINGATHSVATRITGIGNNPTDVAVDKVANKVYVTDPSIPAVFIINGATDTLITELQNATSLTSPLGVAVDPSTHRAFVVNFQLGDGYVTVIDTNTNKITATIPISATEEPYFITVNTHKNEAYLSNVLGTDVAIIATDTLSVKQKLTPGVANKDVTGIAVNSITGVIYGGIFDTNTYQNTLIVVN